MENDTGFEANGVEDDVEPLPADSNDVEEAEEADEEEKEEA